jgi:L-lactate dehydrogenase complex protein LldF
VSDHARAGARFVEDEARAEWHDAAVWSVRERRDRAVAAVPEWETLRDLAAAIKAHTLSALDEYLVQFERNARHRGIQVHWALNAAAHNRIVHELLAARGVTRVVKSKSMLTEECGLNPYLAARGISVVDTDLGERIVQLRRERPSHIIMPAIHLGLRDIGETFETHLGTRPECYEPEALVSAARADLRQRFLEADAAITGANFAVAETGGLVIVTNEGNADLGMSLAPVHIASVGIEKMVPRLSDVGVLLRLLARSATGQAATAYTSHVQGPGPGQEIHVVLVDNGRSAQLGRPEFWRSLACIRCGACMNTCPVYRRSGGHSYGTTVPGPIGAVLTPGLDLDRYGALPFASTLCGSCTAVCPVKIDLDAQLYRWRQHVTTGRGVRRRSAAVVAWMASLVMAWPFGFWVVGVVGRLLVRVARGAPAPISRWIGGAWTRGRALPVVS